MKRYTQKEFDALPSLTGARSVQQETTHRLKTSVMGASSVSDASSVSGASSANDASSVNVASSARCVFERDHEAKKGYPLMAIAGAGSESRTTYFFNTKDGIIVRSGCFKSTLAKFRAKVRQDCPLGTEIKALQHLGFANIVAATWSPEEIEK